MTGDFAKILDDCLGNVAGEVEGLLDAPLVFDLDAIVEGRADAMMEFQGQTLQVSMTARMDDAGSPAGFLVPEMAAIDMGSTLLMIQGEVDQFNAEIASAYDEVLNVIIAGWKLAAPTVADRLNSAQDVRSRDAYTADGFDEFLEDSDLEMLMVPLTFNGATYPFGVIGTREWLGVSVSVADEAPAADASTSHSSAAHGAEPAAAEAQYDKSSPASPSYAGGASTPVATDSPSARMMLVDLSGALNDWLTEQLREGTLRFVRPSDDLHELDERASLVIVGPNPELFRQLQVPQCVVSKKMGADDNETVNLT